MGQRRGRIRRFDASKGWGFITSEDKPREDIFVHCSDVIPDGPGKISLSIGQLVSYDVGADRNGKKKAKRVTALEGSSTKISDQIEYEYDCEGKVSTFDQQKGFGFIERDGKPDVFFHMSNFEGEQKHNKKNVLGMYVLYDIIPAEKGPKAVNIRPENPSWQEDPGDLVGSSNR